MPRRRRPWDELRRLHDGPRLRRPGVCRAASHACRRRCRFGRQRRSVLERVQFLKTGAEATSAAVRIARTYSGRERVVASGYFGWHDWSSDAAGIPASTTAATVRVPFDDVAALDRAASEAG